MCACVTLWCLMFLGALAKLRKRLLASSCPSVCPHGTTLLPLDGFWWNSIFDFFFFENLSRKFKFLENPTRITGTLHEDFFTFMTINRWILLKTRNVLNITCIGNQGTRFMSNKFFFPRKSCRLRNNEEKYGIVRQAADDNMTRRMRFAWWITKATETQST